MKDYLAQSVSEYERRRLRSALVNMLGDIAILVLWVTTAVVLAQRGAELVWWIVMALILVAMTVKLVQGFRNWNKYRKNPHLPPTN